MFQRKFASDDSGCRSDFGNISVSINKTKAIRDIFHRRQWWERKKELQWLWEKEERERGSEILKTNQREREREREREWDWVRDKEEIKYCERDKVKLTKSYREDEKDC